MEKLKIKTLESVYEKLCEINKFYKWNLDITYTPTQASAKTSIVVTQNEDTFSGSTLEKIINLKEMKKYNISYYLKITNNKISLRIFM